MKRRDLIRIIRTRAREDGKSYTQSEHGPHSKITVGRTMVPIPRHNEIPIGTAKNIMRRLEAEFGKGWSGYER